MSTKERRLATLPRNLKFLSIPTPPQDSDPPTPHFSIPSNLKFLFVPCLLKAVVLQHFRGISNFFPFKPSHRIMIRQPHFLLPSRFRRTSNILPFCAHSRIAFRQPTYPLLANFRRTNLKCFPGPFHHISFIQLYALVWTRVERNVTRICFAFRINTFFRRNSESTVRRMFWVLPPGIFETSIIRIHMRQGVLVAQIRGNVSILVISTGRVVLKRIIRCTNLCEE